MYPTHDGDEEVQLYGDNINVKELERDVCCKDIREKVMRKFLVNMPEDFYQFWEFCKYLDPDHPESKNPSHSCLMSDFNFIHVYSLTSTSSWPRASWTISCISRKTRWSDMGKMCFALTFLL